MKKLLFLFAMLISFSAFSQTSSKGPKVLTDNVYRTSQVSVSDTLVVPIDKYKFIKIGDKVYRINITLEEVQKPILFTTPTYRFPPNADNLIWQN